MFKLRRSSAWVNAFNVAEEAIAEARGQDFRAAVTEGREPLPAVGFQDLHDEVFASAYVRELKAEIQQAYARERATDIGCTLFAVLALLLGFYVGLHW